MSQFPRTKKRKIESIQSQALAIITGDYMECMQHSWKNSPSKNQVKKELLEIIKATDPNDYLIYPDKVNLNVSSAFEFYYQAFSARLKKIQVPNERYFNDVLFDFFQDSLTTVEEFNDNIVKLAYLICSIKSIEKVLQERGKNLSQSFFDEVIEHHNSLEVLLAITMSRNYVEYVVKHYNNILLKEIILKCKTGEENSQLINKTVRELLKSESNSVKDFLNVFIKSYVENLDDIQIRADKFFENVDAKDMRTLMKGFVTNSFTFGETVHINEAIRRQSSWTSDTLTGQRPLWTSVCKFLNFEHILSCIENAAKCSSDLNWRRILYFFELDNFVHEYDVESITKRFYRFIDNLIINSFKDKDVMRKNQNIGLKIALFLVRHVSCLELDGIHLYSSWFENTFGNNGKILKNNSTLQCFAKTLIDLIPFEDPFYLKIHIIKKPTRAGDLYQEYKECAHARLNDINEPIPKTGVILVQPGVKNKTSEKAKLLLENALEYFKTSGKISDQVMQASVFSAPFYANEFVTALLEPGALSEKKLRGEFIQKLHKAGKLEAHFVEKYERACEEKEKNKIIDIVKSEGDVLNEKLNKIESQLVESSRLGIEEMTTSFRLYVQYLKLLIENKEEKRHFLLFERFVECISKLETDPYDMICNLFMAKTVYKATVKAFMNWIIKIISKSESDYDSSIRKTIGIFVNIILSQPEISSEEFYNAFLNPITSIDRCFFLLDILNSCFQISIDNVGNLPLLFYWFCLRLKRSHQNLLSKYKTVRKSIKLQMDVQQWIDFEFLIDKEILTDEDVSLFLNLILPSYGSIDKVFEKVFRAVVCKKRRPKQHIIVMLQNIFLRLQMDKLKDLGTTNLPFFIDFFDKTLKNVHSATVTEEEIFIIILDLLLKILSPEWFNNSRIKGVQIRVTSGELLKSFFQKVIRYKSSYGLELDLINFIIKSPDSLALIESSKILKFSILARGLFHYINIEHWLHEGWCSTAISYFEGQYLSSPLWIRLFFLEYAKLTIDGELNNKINDSKIKMGVDCIEHTFTNDAFVDIIQQLAENKKYDNWSFERKVSNSDIYISKLVKKCQNEKYGRFYIAKEDISAGDLILQEKPYTSIIVNQPDSTKYGVCSECFILCQQTFKCPKCDLIIFCSDECLREGLAKYHGYECKFYKLLSMCGIAHLAIRTLFSTDFKSLLIDDNLDKPALAKYKQIYELEPSMSFDPVDSLQFAVMADLMTNVALKSNWCDENFQITKNHENKICGLLFRHILQLINNGQTVSIKQTYNFAVESVNVGSAILPNFAMFNHSCLPNVMHNYENGKIVVRASTDIKAGSQIFNCYGAQAGLMSYQQRKNILSQYGFQCDCEACCNRIDMDKNAFGNYTCEFKTAHLTDSQELLASFVIQFLFVGSKLLSPQHNLLEESRRKIYSSPLMTAGDLKYFGIHLAIQSCERNEQFFGRRSLELANNYLSCSTLAAMFKDEEMNKKFGERALDIFKTFYGEKSVHYFTALKALTLGSLMKRL
ncbi:DgyrCDS3761 [Dimorphilus gyrociliatus]|uniref:Protein-lysine N-methyltransferase SMYD4 n=1 Tax=Dimorphilus gyrociliatus TaxID=2664684 RepID=A0A7I8VHI0_9ANNE|nr:DgyrCDS3761 [Dimorphilus gyrociliatus]